jgi:hypothetical protein
MRIRLLIGAFIVSGLVIGSVRYAANSPEHKLQESNLKSEGGISRSGSITGYVLDVEGKPVYGAKVYADFADAPMGKRRYVLTDDQAHFLIEGLRVGRHTVSAAKEDEGYPPTDIPFYYPGGTESPVVFVNADQTTSGVVVRMGPKAAKLVAQVIDDVTGKSVERAGITLSRTDYPRYTMSFSARPDGEFEILIPSASVELKVSAPDYEGWSSIENRAGIQGQALQLSESETKKLSISLRRIK